MRELRLDSQLIIQLLGDPEFYDANVAFLFARDQNLAAVAQYNDAVLNKQDADCCEGQPQDESVYVAGPLSTFTRIVKQLVNGPNKQPLVDLKNFMAGKLGYTPDSVMLYYTSKGKTKTLEF